MKTIKAEPFDFPFDPSTTALIVIDMQRDFVEEGGFGASLGNDVSRLQAIIPTVARLIDGARKAGLMVVHTRECHQPDLSDLPPTKRDRGSPALRIGDDGPMGRLLVAGEAGADIVPELAPLSDEIVIDKPGKGAFYATELGPVLARHHIRHLIFAGVTTEVCVQTTMREANDRGFECILVTDATESYFADFKAATIAMMTAQGAIVGWATTTDAVLEALNGRG